MEFHWPTAFLTAGVLLLLVIVISVAMYLFNKGQAQQNAFTVVDHNAALGPITIGEYMRSHGVRFAPPPNPAAFQTASPVEQSYAIIGNRGIVRPNGTVDFRSHPPPQGADPETFEVIKDFLPEPARFIRGRNRSRPDPEYEYTESGNRFLKKQRTDNY
ncbi:hypothetical protein ERVG_00443 [Emiliania huxleyi virus 208]|nr:hypothetical protein ERVG_00443 [Emiliania huxleyi virus 208]